MQENKVLNVPMVITRVEEEGVDDAAGDGGDHIAGEIGAVGAADEEAQRVLGGAEDDGDYGTADGGAQGSGQKSDAEGQVLAQRDLELIEDEAGGDHQRGEHQLAQILQLGGGIVPIAAGKGGAVQLHKKTSSALGSPNGSAAQRSEGESLQSRYAAAGCGICTARLESRFVRRTTPRPTGTLQHTDTYSA